jgi:hypothetical protein
LKRIGGKWWWGRLTWQNVILRREYMKRKPTKEELREVYIGWLKEGGVLVLEGDEYLMTGEVGMLRMLTDMEERCQILRERLGAVFYEDPDTYAGFHGLGPMEYEKDSEDEDDEDDEGNNREKVVGRGQGMQAADGKCVCS